MAASRVAALVFVTGGALMTAAAVLVAGVAGGLFTAGLVLAFAGYTSLGGDE